MKRLLPVVLLALAGVGFQDPAADKAKIARLIERLDADTVEARDEAEAELLKIGEPALPQLKEAGASERPEIRERAKRLVAKLEPRVPEAELVKLAASLEELVLKAKSAESLAGDLRKLLREFAERHAPKVGTEVFRTRDGKMLAIALGAAATDGDHAPATSLDAEARWVISVAGPGEVLKGEKLPKGGDAVFLGGAGDATARSKTGIAIALAGDGAVLGKAGGGAGGDAEAASPHYGIALAGLDRTGMIEPPMNGEAKGNGTLEAARKHLGSGK